MKLLPLLAALALLASCNPRLDIHCEVNEKKCSGNDVMVCELDQTGFKKLLSCQREESCVKGQCTQALPNCKERELQCSGNEVVICKPGNKGFESYYLCPSPQTCKDGRCQGANYCTGPDQCSQDGELCADPQTRKAVNTCKPGYCLCKPHSEYPCQSHQPGEASYCRKGLECKLGLCLTP